MVVPDPGFLNTSLFLNPVRQFSARRSWAGSLGRRELVSRGGRERNAAMNPQNDEPQRGRFRRARNEQIRTSSSPRG